MEQRNTEWLPHGGAVASLESAHVAVADHLDAYVNLDRPATVLFIKLKLIS